MHTELNNIVDIIAPKKTRQVRKNYNPYMTETLRQKQQELQKLHSKAKHTGDRNNWTMYKTLKQR